MGDWQIPEWLKRYGRNFYTVSLTVFLIWMLLFDSNHFLAQYGNWRKLQDAYEERISFEEKIATVRAEREQLLHNPQLLEKFAREKYLMKRPTEDLYLVVEE